MIEDKRVLAYKSTNPDSSADIVGFVIQDKHIATIGWELEVSTRYVDS